MRLSFAMRLSPLSAAHPSGAGADAGGTVAVVSSSTALVSSVTAPVSSASGLHVHLVAGGSSASGQMHVAPKVAANVASK